RVHINRKLVFVVKRHLLHEREVLRGKRALKQRPHLLEILFTIDSNRMARVLLKRSFAAHNRREPQVTATIKKIHQHLFVISTQADNSFRILAAEFENVRNATGRIGATVDQVAQKNERVVFRISRQHVEEVEELRAAAMYVANDECFHSDWSPGCSRLLLMRFINSTKRGSSCMSVQFGSDSNHL